MVDGLRVYRPLISLSYFVVSWDMYVRFQVSGPAHLNALSIVGENAYICRCFEKGCLTKA